MSDPWAVKFEGVTKRYRRERTKYRSLRADVSHLTRRLVGADHGGERQEMEALSGIDLEIPAGTTSAVVGRNGAGKSTALRLISRITYPSEGRVRVRGRVGALIEVGAGVHPELSGRENIGLYGSFLGFSRAEIRQRFDQIVDFAEIEPAVDTAVKYYSTGMKLRLGFAIASFLEPSVFIVDESLAVGDGAFQAKCINRMRELGSEGTTIVFVSHELAAVEALCERAIWLDKGRLVEVGPIGEVLQAYSRSLDQGLAFDDSGPRDSLRCVRATTRNALGDATSTVGVGDPLTLDLAFEGPVALDRPEIRLRITDAQREDLIECTTSEADLLDGPIGPRWSVECRIDGLPLNPRMYQIWCSVAAGSPPTPEMHWQEIGAFRIQAPAGWANNRRITSIAGPPVAVTSKWGFTS